MSILLGIFFSACQPGETARFSTAPKELVVDSAHVFQALWFHSLPDDPDSLIIINAQINSLLTSGTDLWAEDVFWLKIVQGQYYNATDITSARDHWPSLLAQVDQFCPDLQQRFYLALATYYQSLNEPDSVIAAYFKTIHHQAQVYPAHHPVRRQANLTALRFIIREAQNYRLADSLWSVTFPSAMLAKDLTGTEHKQWYYYSGYLKRQLSEYHQAVEYQLSALSTRNNRSDSLLLTNIYNELGINYLYLQRNDQALPYLDSAYVIAAKIKDREQLLKNLLITSAILTMEKDYATAIEKLATSGALELSPSRRLDVLSRIANNYLHWGKLDSAKWYYEQLQINLELAKPQQKYYFDYLLAQYHHKINESERALHFINLALHSSEIFAHLKSPVALPTTWPTHIDEDVLLYGGLKAQILCDQFLHGPSRDTALAYLGLKHYEYLQNMVSESYHFADDADELHALDILHEVFIMGAYQLIEIYHQIRDQVFLDIAHRFMDELRARRLYRQLNREQFKSLAGEGELKWLEKEFELSDQLARSSRIDSPNKILELITERNALRDSLAAYSPLIYQTYFHKPTPNIEEVMAWCSRQDYQLVSVSANRDGKLVLLHYGDTGMTGYLFSDSLSIMDSLKIYSELVFGTEHNQIQLKQISRWLFKTLFRPLWPDQLPARVIILPDGALQQIPFHGLLTTNSNSSWTDSTAIAYAHLLHKLLQRDKISMQIKKPNQPLALVNAAKGESDLPYSYREGKFLQKLWRTQRVFFGTESTFKNYKRYATESDMIVLSLHGRGHANSVTSCGIQFRDQFVNYYDLLGEALQARLVILNLCQSQEGLVLLGDGLVNVAQAFLINGAEQIICTYRDIADDKAARLLPQLFAYGPHVDLSSLQLPFEFALYLN